MKIQVEIDQTRKKRKKEEEEEGEERVIAKIEIKKRSDLPSSRKKYKGYSYIVFSFPKLNNIKIRQKICSLTHIVEISKTCRYHWLIQYRYPIVKKEVAPGPRVE